MAVSEQPADPGRPPRAALRSTLLTAAPLALAIGVFGVVFGAAASAQFGAELTIAMSLIVFSGAVQFAVMGLLLGGAGALAVLITVAALNARNLVLGAVLRPRIEGSPLRRAVLAWFLVDESFGLAVASGRRAAGVLLLTGALFYFAWQAGTLLGVLGARAVALEDLAGAVFPVLFIGLAALTAGGREGALRAGIAALIVVALAVATPPLHPFAPIVAALAVALPGVRR